MFFKSKGYFYIIKILSKYILFFKNLRNLHIVTNKSIIIKLYFFMDTKFFKINYKTIRIYITNQLNLSTLMSIT